METGKVRYKYCFVPCCRNTTVSTPDKLFFQLPRNSTQRQNWLKASRRASISSSTVLHCCEDHFNIENDVANLIQYKMYKSLGETTKLMLKKGVVPTKFDCQGGMLVTAQSKRLSVTDRLRKPKVIEELLTADESQSARSAPSTSGNDLTTIVPSIQQPVASTSGNESLLQEACKFELLYRKEPLRISKAVQATIKRRFASKYVQTLRSVRKHVCTQT